MGQETTTKENSTAASAAPSAGTSPAESPSGGSTSAQSDVEKILSFDPFGPEGLEGGQAVTPKKDEVVGEGDGVSDPKAEKPPEEKGQPLEAKPSPTANPELELIKQQLKEATETLAQMKALREEAPAAPKGQEGEQKDNIPPYMFNVPDPLVEMLASEDPKDRKAGIVTLLAGSCRSVHKTVMQEVYEQVAPAIMQMVQQQAQAQSEMVRIHNDFYGKYPEFDKPELVPYVQQTAMALAKELKVQRYDDNFREVLATRLRGIFAVPSASQPAQVPPKITTRGSVRSQPTALQQEQNEMLELLT